MPQFSYKARKRSGELVEGVLEVVDRSAALVQIQRFGLFPISVDLPKAGNVASEARPGARNINLISLLPPTLQAHLSQKRRPKLQELATFTTQLANLLNSGMPLTRSEEHTSELQSPC